MRGVLALVSPLTPLRSTDGLHAIGFGVESRGTPWQVGATLDWAPRDSVRIKHDEIGDRAFTDFSAVPKAIELGGGLGELLNRLLDAHESTLPDAFHEQGC